MSAESQKKSLLEMAKGAIMEQFDVEVSKCVENILDPNTEAKKKRKVTLTIEFSPSNDRTQVAITANAKSAIVPNSAISTSLYVGPDENGEVIAAEMVPQIPGQTNMLGEVQESPKILKMAVGGN